MLEEQKKTVEKKVEDMEDVENTSDADQSPELSDQMYGKSNTDEVKKQETEVRPLNSYSTIISLICICAFCLWYRFYIPLTYKF